MPVPCGAVDQDLAVLQLSRDIEASEGRDEGGDTQEEVDRVDAGDEVEEVAALVGLEEDVLDGKLSPCCPLSGEEEQAECDGGREPGECASRDGFA